METVIIQRPVEKKAKGRDNIDHDLVNQIIESLEDAKHGRIRHVA
ncbi:MAG TPA: hypothetical protein VJH22_04150 [Candidatus Nanoarchaeia archaeon]|nr:hypothetical protein [Candidatus Nanoarchaeia archaeon]